MPTPTLQWKTAARDSAQVHPLDNSIWKALTTRQASFAQAGGRACRFQPEVSQLAALEEPTAEAFHSLASLLNTAEEEKVHLALEAPYQPQPGWKVILSVPALQMVYERDGAGFVSGANSAEEILELGAADVHEMLELTGLTKPGPFSKRTRELGDYIGIRHNGQLVAMAGERLKIPGYTELSAVCTHPDHVGRGYARTLMSKIMSRIIARGETPFLHVRENNHRAVELYEKIGYRRRVLLQHTVLQRES